MHFGIMACKHRILLPSRKPRSFDIYVSNDKVEWQLLGNFDIGDPSDGSGNIPDEKIDEAAQGHDFNLEEVSPEFRFFKFQYYF